jgi:hypothetical protein
MIVIRNYNPNTDYPSVESLYKDSSTYGGQFDETRDSAERLAKLIAKKPDSILIAENDGKIVGTVTLFEDGRSAWLYRFAVNNEEVSRILWQKAKEIFKQKGHSQILVYAPVGDKKFEKRYTDLNFNKGSDYTAYWQDIN